MNQQRSRGRDDFKGARKKELTVRQKQPNNEKRGLVENESVGAQLSQSKEDKRQATTDEWAGKGATGYWDSKQREARLQQMSELAREWLADESAEKKGG